MEARLRLNIDHLLKQKNLRASDLSKLTGIPKQTISEWRSGLVPKSVVALKRVASAFGVSLDDLVFQDQDHIATSQLRPTKKLSMTKEPRTETTAEPYWFSVDNDGYLRSIAPAFLHELDYKLSILLERPLSEFILTEDWLSFVGSSNLGQSHQQQLRFLCRDQRILMLPFQMINVPSYDAQLLLALPHANSPLHIDTPQTCPSEEMMSHVLSCFAAEAWEPKTVYHLAYEGISLPWLTTRRHRFCQSLLAMLHNIAGLDAKFGICEAQERELRVQVLGDSLRLDVQNIPRDAGAMLLEFPNQCAQTIGGLWSFQDDGIVRFEIPLERATN